jgi:hypothetical protein
MRLVLALATTLAALSAGSAQAAAPGDWNPREQQAVVRSGVLPVLGDGEFHGERAVAGARRATRCTRSRCASSCRP